MAAAGKTDYECNTEAKCNSRYDGVRTCAWNNVPWSDGHSVNGLFGTETATQPFVPVARMHPRELPGSCNLQEILTVYGHDGDFVPCGNGNVYDGIAGSGELIATDAKCVIIDGSLVVASGIVDNPVCALVKMRGRAARRRDSKLRKGGGFRTDDTQKALRRCYECAGARPTDTWADMQKVTQVCRKGRGNHTVHGPCNICNCGYRREAGREPAPAGDGVRLQGMRFPDGQEAAALGYPYYWMRQHAFEFGFRRTSQTELFHWNIGPTTSLI